MVGHSRIQSSQKNDDEFLEEQFKMLAESGVELSPVPVCCASEEFRLKTLELAQKNGLKQLVEDYEMSVFLKTLKNRPSVTEEKAVGLIREYSRKYLEYESFAGYFIATNRRLRKRRISFTQAQFSKKRCRISCFISIFFRNTRSLRA